MIGFEVVWCRIKECEGENFRQKRGGEFRYSVAGNALIPDRTDRVLPKSQFEKAFDLVPLENTKPLQNFQGPSYLFAILMDERIRKADW